MTDKIVKMVELDAPVARVWRAISDYREFGKWFRVRLDQPFMAGERSTGTMTYPGYEHIEWHAKVEKVIAGELLSFRWFHTEEGSDVPPTEAPSTLVEFRLEPIDNGTRLTITESGFDSLPDHRRQEIFRGNREGWDIQAENIRAYVS